MRWIVLEASWDVTLMAKPTSMFFDFSGSVRKSEKHFMLLFKRFERKQFYQKFHGLCVQNCLLMVSNGKTNAFLNLCHRSPESPILVPQHTVVFYKSITSFFLLTEDNFALENQKKKTTLQLKKLNNKSRGMMLGYYATT